MQTPSTQGGTPALGRTFHSSKDFLNKSLYANGTYHQRNISLEIVLQSPIQQ